ncbi:TolC family protein [Magnetococcales bacterium HHB-1]
MGYSADLLQAKAQLAGAKARRVTAEGQLKLAINRYHAVFGQQKIETLSDIKEPTKDLPKNLKEASSLAEKSNPDVLAALARYKLQHAVTIAAKNSAWMPRIELQADLTRKREADGVAGGRKDQQIMLQASWDYYVGQQAKHSVKSAQHLTRSERNTADYVITQAIEEVKNAWDSLNTARQKQEYLQEQVNISQAFLKLARKEREHGRRSLLDTLTGETNLINAQSSVAEAKADVKLAAFRLLRATGKLSVDMVKTLNDHPLQVGGLERLRTESPDTGYKPVYCSSLNLSSILGSK